MTSKKKATSVKEKLKIIDSIDKGGKQSSVSQCLRLTKSTVNIIWKNKDTLKRQFESSDFNQGFKCFRPANYKDVDAALLVWFKQARNDNNVVVSCLLAGPLTAMLHSR